MKSSDSVSPERVVALISQWCSKQPTPLDLRWRDPKDDPDCCFEEVNLWEGFALTLDSRRLLDWLGEQTRGELPFIFLMVALRRLGQYPALPGASGGEALS